MALNDLVRQVKLRNGKTVVEVNKKLSLNCRSVMVCKLLREVRHDACSSNRSVIQSMLGCVVLGYCMVPE